MSILLANAALSALLNVILLAAIPFLAYYVYHVRRHGRRLREIALRAGLCLGERRYIVYCVAAGLFSIAVIVAFPPSLEPLTSDGSAWQAFVGQGVSASTVLMALLYGVVKTGFAEELLFRGLIAGSLSRRMPLIWANLSQATIFLLPHLLLLLAAPEMWVIMPLIFAGALFVGWVRIRSGSIVGPWLIHAAVNVTMGLSVALRTGA